MKRLWSGIGRQLAHPRGLSGRLIGRLMRLANAQPNRLAIEALALQPGDRVLELGFGPGHAIALIADQVPRGWVDGIDQSAMMLKQASHRNRVAIRSGRVCLSLGYFTRLPNGDASVDKVLAVNVVYFWHDAPSVLAEVRRVLRPGGRLVIYATEPDALRRWKIATPQTHRLSDGEDLRAMLVDAGFAAQEVRVARVTLRPQVDAYVVSADRGDEA